MLKFLSKIRLDMLINVMLRKKNMYLKKMQNILLKYIHKLKFIVFDRTGEAG